jgi:hypothetical protein
LHELGIIQLPPDFKLKETTTTMSATKKEKKKTTKEPPEAEKPQGARTTVPRVSVPVPKKNITTPRPKAKASIHPTKDQIEDGTKENKQCTTCNGEGIH